MDNNKRLKLGELIEQEVHKQGISISSFGKMIYCTRSNAYDIFKRGDKIDAAQLKLISKVLGRNFFKDLAEDPNLIDLENEEVKKDLENRKAVSQFMDVLPDVLIKMGIEPIIVYSKLNKLWGKKLPDYGLSGFPITFTIGQRLWEKVETDIKAVYRIESYQDPTSGIIDVWINEFERTAVIDIPILYHSEKEWESIMRFTIKEVMPKYGALCDHYAPRIDREFAYRERYNM